MLSQNAHLFSNLSIKEGNIAREQKVTVIRLCTIDNKVLNLAEHTRIEHTFYRLCKSVSMLKHFYRQFITLDGNDVIYFATIGVPGIWICIVSPYQRVNRMERF